MTTLQTRADKKADRVAARIAAANERQRVSDEKIAERKANKAKLVEELASDGKAIKALCASMAEQEKKVEEDLASNTHAKKVFEYKLGIAKRLDDAKVKCKKAGVLFEEFRAEHAPDFGKTKIYQLLQVARGEITFDEIKLLATARKKKSRSTMTTTLHGDGTVSHEPRATGNEGQLSDEEAKARMAKVADEQPTQTAERVTEPGAALVPEPEPVALTAEELSDDALTAFKDACNKQCPLMTDADLKAARVYFVGLAVGKEGWRPKIKKAA